MFLNLFYTILRIRLCGISFVKLHSKSLFFLQIQAYMVECSSLIVNDYQILVDGVFLNF